MRRGRCFSVWAIAVLAGATGSACGGDDSDDVPECKQVLTSCVDSCNITCGSGEEVACAGPDYGFKIGENERCCFCVKQ